MFNKNIPMHVIEFLSSERCCRFYLQPEGLIEHFEEPGSSKHCADNNAGVCTTRANSDWGITISQESKNLLRAWLSLEDPFLCQGELFKRVGITSGSRQAKIKNGLISQTLITEERLQFGRTTVAIWEPTERAYEAIGLQKRRYHSKGGWLHQYVAHHLTQTAKRSGYNVDLEFVLSNGKAVDMTLRKGKEVIFTEIAISEPAIKEMGNIYQDFASELLPDRLVMAAKDSKMKTEIRKLVSEDDRCKPFNEKIQVVLAGDLIKKGIPELVPVSKGKLGNEEQGGDLMER